LEFSGVENNFPRIALSHTLIRSKSFILLGVCPRFTLTYHLS